MEQEDVQRLAKLCGLLSSDFDGERANAAMMPPQFGVTNKITGQFNGIKRILPNAELCG